MALYNVLFFLQTSSNAFDKVSHALQRIQALPSKLLSVTTAEASCCLHCAVTSGKQMCAHTSGVTKYTICSEHASLAFVVDESASSGVSYGLACVPPDWCDASISSSTGLSGLVKRSERCIAMTFEEMRVAYTLHACINKVLGPVVVMRVFSGDKTRYTLEPALISAVNEYACVVAGCDPHARQTPLLSPIERMRPVSAASIELPAPSPVAVSTEPLQNPATPNVPPHVISPRPKRPRSDDDPAATAFASPSKLQVDINLNDFDWSDLCLGDDSSKITAAIAAAQKLQDLSESMALNALRVGNCVRVMEQMMKRSVLYPTTDIKSVCADVDDVSQQYADLLRQATLQHATMHELLHQALSEPNHLDLVTATAMKEDEFSVPLVTTIPLPTNILAQDAPPAEPRSRLDLFVETV